jgi:hypothetical protein
MGLHRGRSSPGLDRPGVCHLRNRLFGLRLLRIVLLSDLLWEEMQRVLFSQFEAHHVRYGTVASARLWHIRD